MALCLVVAAWLPPACQPSDRHAAKAVPQWYLQQRFVTDMHSGGVYLDAGDSLEVFCSATLIAPRVLLTAAHCFKFSATLAATMSDRQFYFQLGHVDGGMPSPMVPIAHAVVHPGYVAGLAFVEHRDPIDEATQAEHEALEQAIARRCGEDLSQNDDVLTAWAGRRITPEMEVREQEFTACSQGVLAELVGIEPYLRAHLLDSHDLAVLFLAHEIAGASAAKLPSQQFAIYGPGEPFIVAGYGRHTQAGDLEPSQGWLHETQSYVVHESQYELLLDNSGKTACFGDSGGGIIRAAASGLQIEGVTSRTKLLPLSGRCWGKAAATKVSAYLPWIHEVMAARGMVAP